jgi:hypothetical protein
MAFHRFGSASTPEDRWYLAGPRDVAGQALDPRLFTQGKHVDLPADLVVTKRRQGRPLDFTLADFDMPVVSRPLARLMLDAAQGCVQLIPTKVEGEEDDYFILNVTRTVPCISDAESLVMHWHASDGRPEKTGQYRMVAKPVLTTANHAGESIFRATGWEIMLLASGELASALLNSGLSGFELPLLPRANDDA